MNDRHVAIGPTGLGAAQRRGERGEHLVGGRRGQRGAGVENHRRARLEETLSRRSQGCKQQTVFVGQCDGGERRPVVGYEAHDDRHLTTHRQQHPHQQHDQGHRRDREHDPTHHQPPCPRPLERVESATPRCLSDRCGDGRRRYGLDGRGRGLTRASPAAAGPPGSGVARGACGGATIRVGWFVWRTHHRFR